MRLFYVFAFMLLFIFAGVAYFDPHSLTEFLPDDSDVVVVATACFLGAAMVLSHIKRPRSMFGFGVVAGLTLLLFGITLVNVVFGWDIHAGLAENAAARVSTAFTCFIGAVAAFAQLLRYTEKP